MGADDDERLVADEQKEPNARAVERLTLFSDAVVAIAITLLALDLPVPGGHTFAQFWFSVHTNGAHYLAFLISFAVIAGAWADHHDVFRYIMRADSRLRSCNMIWLLTIVLTPFATRILTSAGQPVLEVHAFEWGFYALLQVVESGAMLAILRHVVTRGMASDASKPVIASLTRQSLVALTGFGLSIPVFFVFSNAWVLWIGVSIVGGRVLRYLQRNAGDAANGGAAAD